jgi:hypothetical protein
MVGKTPYNHLSRLASMMNSRPSSQDSVMLKFMERAIENINTCLAGQYTLYKLLIERGLITETNLISRLKEDKNLPKIKLGSNTLKDMLSPSWEDQIDFEKTEKELLNEALTKISNITMPEHWKDEGVEPPNSTAMRNAHVICHTLYNNHKIIPKIVASTKENGIYLRFENGDKSFIIETYNDGDIGALVSDDAKKETLFNEEIVDLNFDNSLKVFMDKKV